MNGFLFRKDQAGVTLVLVTFFIVALFAFAAFSIDVGRVRYEQRRAQIATDAAAFAAAAMLTNLNDDVVINEALVIAATNRVSAAEIAAGAQGGFPGQIQIGNWNTTTRLFTANGTPRNAVRVPARKTIPLYFGRIVGMSQMGPAVHSVASLDWLSAVSGMRPFTISSNMFNNAATNQPFTVSENTIGNLNSGQWGQLDYQNTLEGSAWYDAMIGGYMGTIPTGNTWAVLNEGNDHVRQAFNYLIDNHVVFPIPIIDTFVGVKNNDHVNIIGYIGIEVTGYQNRGGNSDITFVLRQAMFTGTGGGTPGPISVRGRFLVE